MKTAVSEGDVIMEAEVSVVWWMALSLEEGSMS